MEVRETKGKNRLREELNLKKKKKKERKNAF